ncbi:MULTISPECIES: COX15/CtaA family protein [Mesobacillus]|uniref:COX15/CtaA family protein n=1 Tax=Mesobacillus TaxID=2675231 RepID=UPI0005C88686|nr:COX15/CtaA family protein [Mesobacillus subterraneus]
MRNRFQKFTIAATILALILGNLVVATNSGDACGSDWPKCNSKLIPNFSSINILIEYSHRLFTTSLGFIILINAILVWKKLKKSNTKSIWPILSIVLLLIQSLVGGLNVLLGTPIGFTTLDVTVSLFLLVSVIYTHNILEPPLLGKKSAPLQKGSFALLVFIFIETIIGAVFKHFRISKMLITDEGGISYILYSIHGLLGIAAVLASSYILFWSLRNKTFRLLSVSLTFFLLLAGVYGFVSKASSLAPVYSSFHMIFTILSISAASFLAAERKGFGKGITS